MVAFSGLDGLWDGPHLRENQQPDVLANQPPDVPRWSNELLVAAQDPWSTFFSRDILEAGRLSQVTALSDGFNGYR